MGLPLHRFQYYPGVELMRIGLVRHFKVEYTPLEKKLLTPQEFRNWLEVYDISGVRCFDGCLGEYEWDLCFCSDMPRAVTTANHIYKGNIIQTGLLREINVYPFMNANIKLPFTVWAILGRVAWFFSHKSQVEGRAEALNRVNTILTQVMASGSKNILIVSHGALMRYLRLELLRKGFRGDNFIKAENGKLYIYEKD